MSNQIKYEYVKRLWFLQGGVIFTRWGNKPVAFTCKDKNGSRYVKININGKWHTVRIYEAVFMLFHDRPIAEGKELEVERPRRQELRLLGLNCRKISRGITASQLRKISRTQNSRLWRTHI